MEDIEREPILRFYKKNMRIKQGQWMKIRVDCLASTYDLKYNGKEWYPHGLDYRMAIGAVNEEQWKIINYKVRKIYDFATNNGRLST